MNLDTADHPSQILRYEVPADGRWHRFGLNGPVIHVAARTPYAVEFWTVDYGSRPTTSREFSVHGTGNPLPREEMSHVGTALHSDNKVVWHLLEKGHAPLHSA